jgi:replicative DNA helicase
MTLLARPGVGKTTFLLNLISRMTAAESLPTLLFSLEQQGAEIFERLGSMVTGIPGSEIESRAREEDPEIAERLQEVCETWKHVVVVEKPCTLERIDQLLEEARRSDLWSSPLRVVGIDYLGLVGHAKPGSPYEQVSRTAREIKTFSKRHRVATVVACQVDREGETGGEPISLRMARDSGVIEEAADYLLGLWRPELRANLTKEARREVKGQFVARVLKNRSGPAPRTVMLQFEPASLRIKTASTAPQDSAEEPSWVREGREAQEAIEKERLEKSVAPVPAPQAQLPI